MSRNKEVIIGAGLAGLIAGHVFPMAKIVEARKSPHREHTALLRFRSNTVGEVVGVPFNEVTVHKGIYSCGKFVNPNIMVANLYSQKVVGRIEPRSILNVDCCKRFVAPDDMYSELEHKLSSRISYGYTISSDDLMDNYVKINDDRVRYISTMPMKLIFDLVIGTIPDRLYSNAPKFEYNGIRTVRWTIVGANAHQTIYYPDHSTPLYRASLVGDILTAECVAHAGELPYTQDATPPGVIEIISESFGISKNDLASEHVSMQKYGKISDISDEWRTEFIRFLTEKYGVYSLGRFATWKPKLLDDVIKDAREVASLIRSQRFTVF